MWNYTYTNELYHYGVLGMKWGVRRNGSNTSSSSKSKRITMHDDYKEAHSKKSVKSMSDNELRKRINRIQMEQQYSKLNPSKIDKGKQYINGVIKAGTTVATVTTTGLTIYNNMDKISKLFNKKTS